MAASRGSATSLRARINSASSLGRNRGLGVRLQRGRFRRGRWERASSADPEALSGPPGKCDAGTASPTVPGSLRSWPSAKTNSLRAASSLGVHGIGRETLDGAQVTGPVVVSGESCMTESGSLKVNLGGLLRVNHDAETKSSVNPERKAAGLED